MSTYNDMQMVAPYFDVKWGPGVPAGLAFEQAQAAMVRTLQKRIDDVQAMSFDEFARIRGMQGVTAQTEMK